VITIAGALSHAKCGNFNSYCCMKLYACDATSQFDATRANYWNYRIFRGWHCLLYSRFAICGKTEDSSNFQKLLGSAAVPVKLDT